MSILRVHLITWQTHMPLLLQVDGLVDHFTGFQREQRTMPVVWHQSLLVFVQRYKNEIRCGSTQMLHHGRMRL